MLKTAANSMYLTANGYGAAYNKYDGRVFVGEWKKDSLAVG